MRLDADIIVTSDPNDSTMTTMRFRDIQGFSTARSRNSVLVLGPNLFVVSLGSARHPEERRKRRISREEIFLVITTTNILAETICADSLDGIVTTQIHPTCRRSLDPTVDEPPRIDPFRRLAAARKEDVDPDDDMNDEDWDDEEDEEWDEDDDDEEWDEDDDDEEWDEDDDDEEDEEWDEDDDDWDDDEDE